MLSFVIFIGGVGSSFFEEVEGSGISFHERSLWVLCVSPFSNVLGPEGGIREANIFPGLGLSCKDLLVFVLWGFFVNDSLVSFYVRDEPLVCSILGYGIAMGLLYVFKFWIGSGGFCVYLPFLMFWVRRGE